VEHRRPHRDSGPAGAGRAGRAIRGVRGRPRRRVRRGRRRRGSADRDAGHLPAGTYTITGKANITRQGAGTTIGSCTLAAGTDTDTANALLSQTLPIGSTVVTRVSHTFTATGSATLTCTGIGGSWVADKAKVIAIKVGALTRTTVNS
jgi:hypothetical protein